MKKFLKNNLKLSEYLLVFLAYLVVAVVVTWPFVSNFSSSVWGYMGDNWGSIWQAWWEKKAVLEGFDYRVSSLVGYPWGTNVAAGGVKEWLWWGPVKGLTFLVGEVPAFNLVSWLSFPAAGFTMYLLSKYVGCRMTDDRRKNKRIHPTPDIGHLTLPAFIAGLIFSFSPYHFWQSYTHVSLGQIQWLPLYFLAFLYFWQKPCFKRGLLWGLGFAALVYSSFYYTYFVFLVSFFLLGFKLLKSPKLLKTVSFWRGLAAFVAVSLLSLLPVALSLFRGQVGGAAGGVLHRDIQDLLSLSLRPWDFLIPAPNHFLWASVASKIYAWIVPFSMDFKTISAYLPERVVYVGWVGLLLGVVGFTHGVKGVKRGRGGRSNILFFATLVCLAVLLGLPPFIYIKTHRILFPSYFLYQIFPMFRVYTRVAVLVQLGVAVLAGVGVGVLAEKLKSRSASIGLIGLIGLMVLLEFQGSPFSNATYVGNLSKVEPAYEWLIEKGKPGAIIEYPQEYDTQEALFFQRHHQRPIFNMLGEPEQYILWAKVANITDPEVPGMLATLGVKYVVWHHSDTLYPKGNPIDEPRYRKFGAPPIAGDTGELALVYKGPDAYIYEITVGPSFGSKEDVLNAVKLMQ
ncbi:MAG: hypothetical protein ABH814_00535 [bacterium]